MRGRRPTPTNLKLVRGVRKDRINDDEPKVDVSIPSPPDYLSQDEQNVFLSEARQLARMRVMSEADVNALAIYATKFIRWRQAIDIVRSTGLVSKTKSGYLEENRFLQIANRCEKEMLDIMRDFGLTPSSRTRIKVR